MSVAFVLGNGLSRKPIPFDPLKKIGKVYACNAVYRQYTPDYLVAVDAKMINEICQEGAQLRMPVWTNPNHAYKKFKKLNFFEPSLGWSSGHQRFINVSTWGMVKVTQPLGLQRTQT